jgi:hypothetical protein
MELVHCLVRHHGKDNDKIPRVNVSVPEIIVLRAIHGDDALEVEQMRYAGERVSLDEDGNEVDFDEMEYLQNIYGKKDETKALLEKLFPGHDPKLPTTLEAIGISKADLKPAAKEVAAKKPKALALAEAAAAAKADGLIHPPRPTLKSKSVLG